MATGIAVRCRRDTRCRQCTGKRLSRAIWPSFNKERMSHLCDSTVAGPTARRDNVLASKCEYPPFRHPRFKCALIKWQHDEGTRNLREPPRGSLVSLRLHYQCTSRRVSEVLSETLSEEDFPLGDSRSCCLSLCRPLIFLQE